MDLSWNQQNQALQAVQCDDDLYAPSFAGYVYRGKVLMMEVAGGVSFKALDKLPAKV
jgi:hypothetical protein